MTASDFTLSPSSTGGGGTSTTASTGQFTQTRSPNLDIFDLQTASDAITVSDSGTATSISVAVDITHTYIEDLQINLIAPDGTSRTLRGHIGGGAHNINQTYSPSLVYKATFSENVTGVTASDFVLSSGSTGSGNNGNSPVTSISGSGDTYHITVSPSTDGTYNLDLVSSGHNIEDAADNPLTNRSPTGADQTYTVSTAVTDNTNPRLASIERHDPASQNTDSQSLTYEATFSENVTGVTASDFVLSSSSTGGGGTATTILGTRLPGSSRIQDL